MSDDWREPSDPVATRAPRFVGYPFTLGVASGSPTPTGVVLWTRLAADAGARSTLMVSGDAHTNYVADLHHDGPIVATEFCGTSITSQGRPQPQTDAIREANPHIHLANSERRGYVVFDVEAARVRARLRVVGDVRDRATGVETLATFTVAAGRPGAQGE